jgi:hypothetical protein
LRAVAGATGPEAHLKTNLALFVWTSAGRPCALAAGRYPPHWAGACAHQRAFKFAEANEELFELLLDQKTQLRNCFDDVTGNTRQTALTNVICGCKRGHTRGFDAHTKCGENSHIATVRGSRVGSVSVKEST